MNLTLLSFIVGTYVLGAIPFGLIVAYFKKVNLRQVGSGNIGATNVFRSIGWPYGLIVFLLDGIKGAIPTYVAVQWFENPWIHVGVGFVAILGHTFTMFAQFKGGKGAATGLGVLLALSWPVWLILFSAAVILIALFRYVAPVTIACSIAAPILLWVFKEPREYSLFVALIAVLIVVRHKDNIKRLLKGEENKII